MALLYGANARAADQIGDAHCATALSLPPASAARTRGVVPADLATLRDFGGYPNIAMDPPFAISPDGTRIAVQVRRGDPERNLYCQGMLVIHLNTPTAAPLLVNEGGEWIRDQTTMYGLNGFPQGTAVVLTPAWSPDGRWIAFRRREAGVTQAWIAAADGSFSRQVTDGSADILDVAWSGSSTLLFHRDDALADARQKILADGRNGYLYGDDFWSMSGARPYPRGELPPSLHALKLSANGDAVEEIALSSAPRIAPSARSSASISADTKAPGAYRSVVHYLDAHGESLCVEGPCADAARVWPIEGGVLFLARTGFALSQTGLFRWDGASSPRPVLKTDDALFGCDLRDQLLYCARETSIAPRHLVAIDIKTGRVRPVFDFNPEWQRLRLGQVQRLRWTNRFGLETFADLVLPPDHRAGEKHPLIVVTYESRGFLRGGTGDEYPIQAFANAGFAVLSLQRPMDYSAWMTRAGRAFSPETLQLTWMDRQSVQDSLMKGLERIEAMGVVDQDHIAISGLSDGATTAEYAVIHSRDFSLALLSTCCEDPAITNSEVGPAYNAMLASMHYPLPWQQWRESWNLNNLAAHAADTCAALFIQASDGEFRMGLSTYQAWKDQGRPVTLYVYPDEYHIKWQPAHRLRVYQRNLDRLEAWAKEPRLVCD